MSKASRRALASSGAITTPGSEIRDADYARKFPAACKAYAKLQHGTALGLFDFGEAVDDLAGSTKYGTQRMAAVAEDLGAALSTVYRARQLFRAWGKRKLLQQCFSMDSADGKRHLSTEHYLAFGKSETPEDHARIAIEHAYTPQQLKALVAGQQVTEQRMKNKATSRKVRKQGQASDGPNDQNSPEDVSAALKQRLDVCLVRAQAVDPNDSRLSEALTVAQQVVHELETKIQSQKIKQTD